MRLQQWYRDNVADPASDIAPHFPALMEAVRSTGAVNVIELGVRTGASSSAFLMALVQAGRGALWSIDLEPPAVPPLVGAAMNRVAWNVLVADDLSDVAQEWLPMACDVLFIDTSHAFEHTIAELDLYAPRVVPGGRILLHDTANEFPHLHDPAVPEQRMPFPVRAAVEAWCEDHWLAWSEDPQSWGLATIEV